MRKEQLHQLLMRSAISARELAVEMGQGQSTVKGWLAEAKSGVQLNLPSV